MDKKPDNEIPILLKERIDLKALTAKTFVNVVENIRNGKTEEISVDLNTEIWFFTNFGLVSGSLYIPPEENDAFDPTYFLHELVFKTRNSLLSSYIEKGVERLTNDSSFVLLKDVTVKPYASPSTPYKLGYFLLYGDAILGISFGDQPKEQYVHVVE
ncbi:hypothetical protein CI793_09365 [Anoxybacillus ayderensis]|uniref:hypothetical protein n=1 Tax=Anoxybacillus sp. ST70 TaxID=2864180 RepID=UPI0002E5387E|nr:hypothetical protein [Anoxybacillus sp. ST70]AXM89351.1 hypothetical protein B379_09525 [Anoxybacillus ayderensis G10]MBW9219364.1 hypothetical protein [Anoxybacillus sp. ST70]THD16111.1 hypothetical protein CI793_09365 [Anoxybacillus ayderensis]